MLNGWGWILMDIIGPLLLLGLIGWVVLRNRTNNKNVSRAERGARELREELAREDEN